MKKYQGIVITIAVAVVLIFVGGIGFDLFNFTGSTSEINMANENASQELKIQDLVVGSGTEAVPGKVIVVHYTGMFSDGTKFDSSRDRDVPFSFTLGAGQVIKGWDLGVSGMKVGGKRILTIPPELAYGDAGVGPIPGGATLYFEVELLDVK